MATYPAIDAKSKIRPKNNAIKTDLSDGGVLRGQDLSAQSIYEIELEHPLISSTDVQTLETFWTTNKNTLITTQTLADGHTYSCLHVEEPEVEDVNSAWKTVRQKLIGTRI